MNLRNNLALTLVCLLLGVGLVAQLRARRWQAPLTNVSGQDQATLLGSLVVANAGLRNEVKKLESEIQAYESTSERVVLPQMQDELDRMRIINGSVQVAGAGVEVRVGEYVIVLYLQDVLNELRNAGAEAISLNDIRLTIDSSIMSDEEGKGIIVDGRRVYPPFVFRAIGDPATISTAMNRRGGTLELIKGVYPGLEMNVKNVQLMILPPRQARRQFVLAQPVE